MNVGGEEGKKGREIEEGSLLTVSLVSLQSKKKVGGRIGVFMLTHTHTHEKTYTISN